MTRLYSLLLSASLAVAALLSATQIDSALAAAKTAKSVNIIITMRDRTDAVLGELKAKKFASNGKRATAMRDRLEDHAKRTQQDVFTILEKSGTTYTRSESYWLTNQIFVEGATSVLVNKLNKLPSVLSVVPEQVIPMVYPTLETSATTTSTVASQWGVSKIRAPEVWATGNTGKGIVVGIIDTGVRHTHKDIAGNFRQEFGWYDPEKKSATPYDAAGHGTHVTGIIAGANGIGVAPGVTWIMCKGCRANGCYLSDLLACFQFMACPTTPDGLTKDCSKQPDIVNNSWGAGQGVSTFDAVVALWHANQIIPVFAGGNAGPACGTITSPGDKANVITVGATDSNDVLASFSSKGPTVNGLRKPDVLAPGASIRSSCYTGDADYCIKSGTSMATPHVVGMIALYLARYPAPVLASTTTPTENSAPYVDVATSLRAAALTSVLTTATGYTCGNTADTVFPNNQFGFGRLDAMRLLSIVPNYSKQTSTPAPATTAPTTTAPVPTTTAPTTTSPAPTTITPVTTAPAPTTITPVTTAPAPTTITPVTTAPAPTTITPVTTAPAPTSTTPVTTAPTPTTTAPTATSSCNMEVGLDYTGNDIGSAPATAASSCCTICAARTGCKAFSWNNYNGGTCWLKSLKASTTANTAVTSGTI